MGIDHEVVADNLRDQNKYREAADEYAKALRPYKGYNHTVRIAKKQFKCLIKVWEKVEIK